MLNIQNSSISDVIESTGLVTGAAINGYDVVLNKSNITFKDCSVENISGVIDTTSGEINIFHSKVDFENVSAAGNVAGIAWIIQSNTLLNIRSAEIIIKSIKAN